MDIHNQISVPALLELTAEECVELAHACLKLARYLRGENPTPAEMDDMIIDLHEEIADVLVCSNVLVEAELLNPAMIEKIEKKKIDRWAERLKENNKEKGE